MSNTKSDLFALFAGCGPAGGWKDFIATSDDPKDLRSLIETARRKRTRSKWYMAANDETWWHIVELNSGRVVEDEKGAVSISTELWIERS